MTEDEIKAKINQRRRQVLIHSYLYYQMFTSVISDWTWSTWAKELAGLQEEYPDIAAQCVFAEEFKDFDWSTGAGLWFGHPETEAYCKRKAIEAIRRHGGTAGYENV